jgi:hypothetical protein
MGMLCLLDFVIYCRRQPQGIPVSATGRFIAGPRLRTVHTRLLQWAYTTECPSLLWNFMFNFNTVVYVVVHIPLSAFLCPHNLYSRLNCYSLTPIVDAESKTLFGSLWPLAKDRSLEWIRGLAFSQYTLGVPPVYFRRWASILSAASQYTSGV